MLLFAKTKRYFQNWVRNLISYTLQPVLVFSVLAVFNVFVYSTIYALLNYRICWVSEIFRIAPANFELLSIPYFYHYEISGALSDTPKLFMAIIFIIMCHAMVKLIDFMAGAASYIATGNNGANLAEAAQKTMDNAVKLAKALATGGKSLTEDMQKEIIKKAGVSAATKAAAGDYAGAAADVGKAAAEETAKKGAEVAKEVAGEAATGGSK